MKTKLSKLWTGLCFVWENWRLIVSFTTLPKLPTDWQDAECVRLYFVAFVQSEAVKGLTELTPTQWDDHARAILLAAAETPSIWEMAWNVLHRDSKPSYESSTEQEYVERLVRAIKVLEDILAKPKNN